MSRNLTIAAFAALLLIGGTLATSVNAQPPNGNRNQPGSGGNQPPALPDSTQIEQIVAQTAATLDLTDEQTGQVSELYFEHFDEAQKLLDGSEDSRDDQRRKMDVLRADLEEEVKAVLNDEQKAEFEKMMASHEKGRRPRGQR